MTRTPPILGIGITTYNRADRLAQTLDAVRRHTRMPHVLFVADDGSTDHTTQILRDRPGIVALHGSNRGIAWNKNRALYYLHMIRRCDFVILLEDDTYPIEDGWEQPWVEGAGRYGHLNLSPSHWDQEYLRGDGSVENPYLSRVLTGQCGSFSAAALDQVGYLDTRFRRYGYEHAEHTHRMIAAGYGGERDEAGKPVRPLLIRSPLVVTELDKAPDHAGIAANAPIFMQLESEPLYRHAWRGDDELAILRAEMLPFAQPGTAASRPVAWQITNFEERSLCLSEDGQITPISGENVPGRLVVMAIVIGRAVRLLVDRKDAGGLAWLAHEAQERFVITQDFGAASVFMFHSASGKGFGLGWQEGFLCSDQGRGGMIVSGRTTMSLWETFHFTRFGF